MIVVGAKRIAHLRSALLELRERVGQEHDILTSPDWFVSRTLMWDALPVVVVQSADQMLQSAVLMHVRCWHGIRTGVLKCGDLVGDGGVIAQSEDREPVLKRAMEAVIDRRFAHTVVGRLRFSAPLGGDGRPAALAGDTLSQTRDVRRHLDLSNGLEAFLARQSRKFRRNLRYYRRRAEADLGCTFLPELSAEQSRDAMHALHGQGRYQAPAKRALRHEAALRATPGSFAMGLLDRNGRWLSYLAGWRQASETFVELQINTEHQEPASLVMAMRSFLLEHEAANGSTSLAFVGGTTGAWARACRPETCLDLFATGGGLVSRKLAALLAWLRPNGQVATLRRQRSTDQMPKSTAARP